MWYQIFGYFKFFFKSTNQHGVHSPFVYELITKCFYDTSSKEIYKTLQQYRDDLLKDETIIEIKDFGAGSRVFSSYKRKVSAIAKNAGITPKRAKLLARLIPYLNIEKCLELGTSLGIGTIAMKEANEVFTLEGCPETAKIAQKQLKKYAATTVKVQVAEFSEVLSKFAEQHYDLIYFDGNHQKEATLQYFEQLLKTAHNDSVFIFDDIHWSKEMTEAWEIIKNHPKVTVTIDTFFWGFVFFRKEQVKEHFIVRL
ncbi:class I SAM-dependent methyltransferase [Kordia algicida OT-1]|uniref:SAM-dependent methyltransferase O-methyltransferase n=1 Tax=Kordia algicida OT-1 TaxID=391587 RepID=A9ED48_9FLAO|nr:class I SAM-dependent methyltransferase [Kordia algicida]EDP94277.1 SAM-dependent methyltransferase; O-methyltransferase [Kordia algicida OT-1]